MPSIPLNHPDCLRVKDLIEKNSTLSFKLQESQKCLSCHTKKPLSGTPSIYRLALYTDEWITLYANGENAPQTGQMRFMPKFSNFSQSNAREFKKYIKSLIYLNINPQGKLSNKEKVKQTISRLNPKITKSFDIQKHFLQRYGCVHCHSGEAFAKRQFNSTVDGLKLVLSDKLKREKFFTRLIARHDEVEHGIGSKSGAGMPLGLDPVPLNVIAMLYQLKIKKNENSLQ